MVLCSSLPALAEVFEPVEDQIYGRNAGAPELLLHGNDHLAVGRNVEAVVRGELQRRARDHALRCPHLRGSPGEVNRYLPDIGAVGEVQKAPAGIEARFHAAVDRDLPSAAAVGEQRQIHLVAAALVRVVGEIVAVWRELGAALVARRLNQAQPAAAAAGPPGASTAT